MARLEGKAAIITGAGEGIERHIALGFARAGASVTLVVLKEGQTRETARLIEGEAGPGRTLAVTTDVGTAEG